MCSKERRLHPVRERDQLDRLGARKNDQQVAVHSFRVKLATFRVDVVFTKVGSVGHRAEESSRQQPQSTLNFPPILGLGVQEAVVSSEISSGDLGSAADTEVIGPAGDSFPQGNLSFAMMGFFDLAHSGIKKSSGTDSRCVKLKVVAGGGGGGGRGLCKEAGPPAAL
jgi:hypothetical protein